MDTTKNILYADNQAFVAEKSDRKAVLLKVFENIDGREVIEPMIDDVVFLEERLEELRALPLIRVNPADTSQQKATPAAKLYKELLQQYNGLIKTLTILISRSGGETDDSPLREYFKAKGGK